MLTLHFESDDREALEQENREWAGLFVGADKYVEDDIFVGAVMQYSNRYHFDVVLDAPVDYLTHVRPQQGHLQGAYILQVPEDEFDFCDWFCREVGWKTEQAKQLECGDICMKIHATNIRPLTGQLDAKNVWYDVLVEED